MTVNCSDLQNPSPPSSPVNQAWYYAWRRDGLDALAPKLAPALREAILAAKRANARRSVRQIVGLLEAAGTVASGTLSRSAVHRLLQRHGLSRSPAHKPEERRSFAAEFAGTLWCDDVTHGPRVPHRGQLRKTYLVSAFDDASRLVAHRTFCLGETALDIEGVLKQALLRRGVHLKLVVDNGAAYRAATLQGICAQLGIQQIFCRPRARESWSGITEPLAPASWTSSTSVTSAVWTISTHGCERGFALPG
ncbi:DDE-type integrase/transposase/recombinase [Roseateles cellulosilyticus]|uniref:DDE-type integrase/transposase/recombinase n=1 Tax=Pelomonas cellulosilytica TaxID=2906762 RepID=A0ABS8Y4Q6_9BURK|nr:DDE-type integrase/transposase/recombinase [Pelomonas sp. P8]MCE4558239.1 DDE-type integrase/transposase/recombinase [Pelomonas sp. P8]